MRPPSQAFQFRVIVSAIASAISTTSSGVPNRRQVVFRRLILGSLSGRGAATIEPVAISSILPTNATARRQGPVQITCGEVDGARDPEGIRAVSPQSRVHVSTHALGSRRAL